ncbi:MAG: DUF2269 family protein [Chloroflexota bacterium]
MLTSAYGWLLLVHIGAGLVGLGPSFVYGRITQAAASAGPGQMPFAVRLTRELSTRWTHPLAAIVLLSGLGLVWTMHYDILRTPWLLVSTALFLASFLYATFIQNRDTMRSLELIMVGLPNLSDEQRAEAARLRRRIRWGGLFMRVVVLVVLFLMVMKPQLW